MSVFTGGAFFGALFAGPIGDRFGRKLTILIGSIIFCLGGALQTAAMNIKSPYIQGQGPEGAPQAEEATTTEVRQNTSPGFPPVPQDAPQGMNGIETPTTADNLA